MAALLISAVFFLSNKSLNPVLPENLTGNESWLNYAEKVSSRVSPLGNTRNNISSGQEENCTVFSFEGGIVDYYINDSFLGTAQNITICWDTFVGVWDLCIDKDRDGIIDECYEIKSASDSAYDTIFLVPTNYSSSAECSWYSKHVTPYDPTVKEFLNRSGIKPTDSELRKLFKIFRALLVLFNYEEDEAQFGVDEYWEYPNRTLTTGKGDCEDWTVAFLSLIEAANFSKTKCYAVTGEIDESGHAFVICKSLDGYYIFDQGVWRKGKTLWLALYSYKLLWNAKNVTIDSVFNSTFCSWVGSPDDFYRIFGE